MLMATDGIADCQLPIADLKFAISNLELVPEDIADCRFEVCNQRFEIGTLKDRLT
jgi:hypothetical protein